MSDRIQKIVDSLTEDDAIEIVVPSSVPPHILDFARATTVQDAAREWDSELSDSSEADLQIRSRRILIENGLADFTLPEVNAIYDVLYGFEYGPVEFSTLENLISESL